MFTKTALETAFAVRKIILVFTLLVVCSGVYAQTKPVQFTAKKELPVLGSTTQTVAIRVTDFTNVTTTQFTLQWPATAFQFASLSDFGLPGLDITHFNTTLAATGKLTFSWDDASTNGLTVIDGTVIFKIKFTVIGSIPAGSVLELTASPTPTEVTRSLKPTSVMFNNESLSGCECK
ncbi:MAG: cohesin domain-containing protein [Bacteroidota bacterium]